MGDLSLCLSLSVSVSVSLASPAPPPTPHSVISYVVTQLCRGRLHRSKDHDPTLSIINRTLHLLPSASLLSPASITVSTISSIFIVGDTVLISIIGYAYTIFIKRLPIPNFSNSFMQVGGRVEGRGGVC